jgi:thiol-disulfide isomerase/thioredoxin
MPASAASLLSYIARTMLRSNIAKLMFVGIVLAGIFVSAAQDEGPAPRFRAKTMTGENFNNESVKGKVVLLEFWTTWCPYCRREQETIDDIDKEFADKGLLVLAIDVGESKKTVKQYLEENPRSCRIVLMQDTNLAAMYAAKSYPIYVVIDRDGNIVGTQRGAAGERGLRAMLSRAGLESASSD